ncbi:MAG: PilT/PilU family type 4a pilus ATPase [Candidatus Sericytochromatia bacterium]|nr:PilT/PilU family type 4a pilus ATPase [Candidatus Sericytochromatia bacterium]
MSEMINQPRKSNEQVAEELTAEDLMNDELINNDALDDIYNKLSETPFDQELEELEDAEYTEDLPDHDHIIDEPEEELESNNEQEQEDLDLEEFDKSSDESFENMDAESDSFLDSDPLDDELPIEDFENNDDHIEEYVEESEEQIENQDLIDEDLLDQDISDDVVNSEEIEEVNQEVVPELQQALQYDFEEVKKEIQAPLNIENAAQYLLSLPILGDIVKETFLANVKKETDDVKLRGIRVATQKEIVSELKEQRQPYIVTHFTTQENFCNVDKNCPNKLFKSVYYEISNPVTNKNVMLTSQMFHNITRHNMAYFNEPLLNLGNSPQGFYDAYLPCTDLIKVLEKSNASEQILDELNQIKDKIEYLEDQRFAAVRANIKYDMSVFEQTEYEKEHNIIPFYSLLRTMVNWGAEDIHIKAGFRPMGVVSGNVVPCPNFPDFLTPERTKYYSNYLLTEPQQQQFEETLEMDNSFYVPDVARFRCNMYHSQGAAGLVFRVIPTKIRPVEVLGVPMILKKLVFERLGLVLVTGQTGSGKTTTLAAIVEFCNVNRAIHILTLENPVEYVYESKSSIFTQRAIEIDSLSFPMAMRGALRQKPDIILIGEMRDPDTIMAGLKAAETGHLVMSTLHTNDAVQTINRIVNTFPPHEQETIRVQVGSTIKACVAQRLIPRFDKPGRVCSIEVLLVTPNARGQNTRGYIIRNEVPELYKVVATSGYDGMQSMNMALFEHYKNGVITPDDALSYSDNPDEITRWIREDMGLGVSNM